MKHVWIVGVAIVIIALLFYLEVSPPKDLPSNQISMKTLSITSSAFTHNSPMPSRYTCDGQNINPPLSIGNVPDNAKSLVLIMDDPDAPRGTWDHWILWNIDPKTREIKGGEEPAGIHGKGSGGESSYQGPCPPSGTHRYIFKVYALDSVLNLSAGASKKEVENAMQNHVLGSGEIIGLYSK